MSMIKCYYIFKTYYGEFGLDPIGYMSYYEWVIFGCTFKTKIKNITYQKINLEVQIKYTTFVLSKQEIQSGGEMVNARQ